MSVAEPKFSSSGRIQFLELYLPYAKKYAVAITSRTDPFESDDLVSDFILKVLLTQSLLPDNVRAKSWICTVILRAKLDQLRQVQRFYSLDEALLQPVQSNFLAEIESSVVRDVISGLPTQYGDILVLHYLEELDYEEMAFVCNLAVEEIKTRLNYARYLLRSALRKHFD